MPKFLRTLLASENAASASFIELGSIINLLVAPVSERRLSEKYPRLPG